MMLHRNLLPSTVVPRANHSIGRVGLHHFDLSSTITAGSTLLVSSVYVDTWISAYAAVQTALTATESVMQSPPNEPNGVTDTLAAFALIRPPGHHATTNLCGGYCYLNNAIICASHVLRNRPSTQTVIIDVDFHHGNGVEEILSRKRGGGWWERCKYISLHAHPDYPYYTTHLPTAVKKEVTAEEYIAALQGELVKAVEWCGEETLVLVSLGLDTLAEDPVGGFAGFTSQDDYFAMGVEIGRFVRCVSGKTCFLLEGGYVVEKLGECIEGVFRGYITGVQHN
jgi:acetoin utilization deacetylase AcuC-like enzyme